MWERERERDFKLFLSEKIKRGKMRSGVSVSEKCCHMSTPKRFFFGENIHVTYSNRRWGCLNINLNWLQKCHFGSVILWKWNVSISFYCNRLIVEVNYEKN